MSAKFAWHCSYKEGFNYLCVCVCVCVCVRLPLPPKRAHQGNRLPTEEPVPFDILTCLFMSIIIPIAPNECVPVSAIFLGGFLSRSYVPTEEFCFYQPFEGHSRGSVVVNMQVFDCTLSLYVGGASFNL